MTLFIIAFTVGIASFLWGIHIGEAQADRAYIKALKEHADKLQEFVDDSKRREAELLALKQKVADLIKQAVKAGIL